MIVKSLIAALAVTMTVALPTQEAKADLDVNIGVGLYPGYGDYNPGYPGYYDDDVYPVYKKNHISCGKGAKIVDYSGFYKVKAIDCSLPKYKYTAWKKGKKYVVVLNGKGNIINYYKI